MPKNAPPEGAEQRKTALFCPKLFQVRQFFSKLRLKKPFYYDILKFKIFSDVKIHYDQKPAHSIHGSRRFAVPVLEALANSHDLTLAVAVTQPDRAAGRKRILTPTPLGRFADAAGIPCERVQSVNTPEFLEHARRLEPDMIKIGRAHV